MIVSQHLPIWTLCYTYGVTGFRDEFLLDFAFAIEEGASAVVFLGRCERNGKSDEGGDREFHLRDLIVVIAMIDEVGSSE